MIVLFLILLIYPLPVPSICISLVSSCATETFSSIIFIPTLPIYSQYGSCNLIICRFLNQVKELRSSFTAVFYPLPTVLYDFSLMDIHKISHQQQSSYFTLIHVVPIYLIYMMFQIIASGRLLVLLKILLAGTCKLNKILDG